MNAFTSLKALTPEAETVFTHIGFSPDKVQTDKPAAAMDVAIEAHRIAKHYLWAVTDQIEASAEFTPELRALNSAAEDNELRTAIEFLGALRDAPRNSDGEDRGQKYLHECNRENFTIEQCWEMPSEWISIVRSYYRGEFALRTAPDNGQNEWRAAATKFDSAWRDGIKLSQEYSVASDQITSFAPLQLTEMRKSGRHERWHSFTHFENDKSLTSEQRRVLTPLAQAWFKAKETLSKVHRVDEIAEQCDANYDEMAAAYERMTATPVPDLAALRYKIEQIAMMLHDEKVGFADLAFVTNQRYSYWSDQGLLAIYEDVLRLSGDVENPILHMGDFSARAWIKAYAELGGKVYRHSDVDEDRLIYGFELGTEVNLPAAIALEKQIAEPEWRLRAVAMEAKAGEKSEPILVPATLLAPGD